MNSRKNKKIMNIRSILLSLSIIIFICSNISTVSAATINIAPGLQNNEIQSLINGSNQGDTINFLGSSYSNISLIINKKLNIISNKNTVIIGNNSTSTSNFGTFVFYFTNKSLGSVISGFNIVANSDYGIIAVNVKNITIKFNKISESNQDAIYLRNVSNSNINQNNLSDSGGNGLNIDNSKNVSVNKNKISNNNYSGIDVLDSSNIGINSNNVINNNLSGLSVYSSKNVSVTNNSLNNNEYGAYLSNTYNVNITHNQINKNHINGISLEDTTENTYISQNNISSNVNGIYIDSYSVNDTIISNTIVYSVKSAKTYLDVFDTGDGIGLGDNYQESNHLVNIKYNIITNNQNFAVKSNPQYSKFVVGPNWYGSNDPEETGVCPMVCTAMMRANLLKTTKGYQLGFYDGNTLVKILPQLAVTFQLNGKNLKTVLTTLGQATYNYNMNTSKQNVITATAGKTELSLILVPKPVDTNNNGNASKGTPNNNQESSNSSTDTANSGNSTTNGSTNTSSGNQPGTTNVGIIGNSISQKGSFGTSDTNGQNSIEVTIKNSVNTIKNNPYTILAIFALLALIAVGYFKTKLN